MVTTFVCIDMLNRIDKFRNYYNNAITIDGDVDAWRIGKGQVKLRKIDDSVAQDRVDFGKVQLMIKQEVSGQTFYEPSRIKKARGIQFTVNERSAYERAREYYAFSSGLVALSTDEVSYDGVDFLVVYSSKMNHDDIGNFATESERLRRTAQFSVIDERDGKNWDANVQVCHRMALIDIYRQLDPRLAEHAQSGVHVKGTYRSKQNVKITYEVNGTVKSGHPDTSSGNGALNREVTIKAVISLPRHLRPIKVRGLVMGDDYIAWLYFDHAVDLKELKAALNEAEARLGIHPERGLFLDIRNASFISLGFYTAVDGTIIPLPKVGRLLYRLFWTVTALQGRDPRRLASGIAASFYPLYQTLPYMRKFLKYHMQVPPLDVSDCNHYYCWDEIGSRQLAAPIDWTANHLVKYGPLACLYELPPIIDGEQGAGVISDQIVDMMYRTDVADPADRLGCNA